MTLKIDADEATTKTIKSFAAKHGMSVSAFMKATTLEAIDKNHVPEERLEPTPYLIAIMKQADEDLKAGRASGPFSKEEAIAHLRGLMDKAGDDPGQI